MDLNSGINKKKVSLVKTAGSSTNSITEINMYGHLNLSLALFMTIIALYVVDFVYLFQSKTEYLAWIFAFMLNILFPISWAMDIMKYPTTNYKYYLIGCIVVGIILELTALLIILITNSIIQKRIMEFEQNKRSSENKDPKADSSNTSTYDKITNTISGIIAEIITVNYWLSSYFKSGNAKKPTISESSYKVPDIILRTNDINKKLYTTTAVLIIGAVSNYFVDQVNDEIKKGLPPRSNLGNNIQWWLSLIPKKIEEGEILYQNAINTIPIDPFIRFFFLFCGGFSAFFFSFVRIFPNFRQIDDPYLKDQGVHGYVLSTYFDIPTFPDIYNQSAGPVNFQVLVSFFFGILMFILIPFLATIFNIKSVASFVLLENPSILTIILYVGWLLLFIVPFVSGISTNPVRPGVTNTETNNFLMVIIGFLFALLGTPVLFMVLEFLLRFIGEPLSRYLKRGWYNSSDENLLNSIISNMPFTSGRTFSDPYNWIVLFIATTFLGLWIGIMSNGIKDNWLNNGGNGKIIKFIIIFLISMSIGWAAAFSPYFNVITIFINIATVPIKTVLFFLAPITIVALTITQLALAEEAKSVLGNVSDG